MKRTKSKPADTSANPLLPGMGPETEPAESVAKDPAIREPAVRPEAPGTLADPTSTKLPEVPGSCLDGMPAADRAATIERFRAALTEDERRAMLRFCIDHPDPGSIHLGGHGLSGLRFHLSWFDPAWLVVARHVANSLTSDQGRKWRMFWLNLSTLTPAELQTFLAWSSPRDEDCEDEP